MPTTQENTDEASNSQPMPKGITRRPNGSFTATVCYKNSKLHVGTFRELKEAKIAYDVAAYYCGKGAPIGELPNLPAELNQTDKSKQFKQWVGKNSSEIAKRRMQEAEIPIDPPMAQVPKSVLVETPRHSAPPPTTDCSVTPPRMPEIGASEIPVAHVPKLSLVETPQHSAPPPATDCSVTPPRMPEIGASEIPVTHIPKLSPVKTPLGQQHSAPTHTPTYSLTSPFLMVNPAFQGTIEDFNNQGWDVKVSIPTTGTVWTMQPSKQQNEQNASIPSLTVSDTTYKILGDATQLGWQITLLKGRLKLVIGASVIDE